MAKYAQNTEVSQEKSRAEIESTLRRYGADAFSYGWADTSAVIAFRAHNRQIRFEITMPDKTSDDFRFYYRGHNRHVRTTDAAIAQWEQACRQRWRALALVVKAKLEAVDAGISEFETEFLGHIVMPDGRTVSEHILPRIEEVYLTGEMPKHLLLTAGSTG